MSEKVHGFIPVLTAVLINIFITVIKFVGFFMSGSGAMFSEAVHSLADAGNQALLLVGIKRSQKKPDSRFHYGYGQERFFWALVSACGIFFVGAGVTVYHGFHALLLQERPEISNATFLILAVSLILEAVSFRTALHELKEKGNGSLWNSIKKGDPSTLAVLYEDGVALLGIILAFISILLVQLTGNYLWDAWGSIIIGFLLGGVAIVLANINRTYLIELAMPEELSQKTLEILHSSEAVSKVADFRSSTIGIDEYRVRCEIAFNAAALKFEGKINHTVQNIIDMAGEEIDNLKKEIQKSIPGIKHLVIEISR